MKRSTRSIGQGEPFAQYVKRAVLEPLGMMTSAFEPDPTVVDDLDDMEESKDRGRGDRLQDARLL